MKSLDCVNALRRNFRGVWTAGENDTWECDDGRSVVTNKDKSITLKSDGVNHIFTWHQLGIK